MSPSIKIFSLQSNLCPRASVKTSNWNIDNISDIHSILITLPTLHFITVDEKTLDPNKYFKIEWSVTWTNLTFEE
jgi:hypothetical protein